MKRFYVGALHIGAAVQKGRDASCTHDTVEEAVEDAKAKIRRDQIGDCFVVVQIVRVVRKDDPPITVETV